MTETASPAEDDLEPYCATCGAAVGLFIGHGEDWHHFRGTGTVADPNRLYDSDHEPVVAWREPRAAAQVTEGTDG
jgi:hypothetical protein